jgi:hypothetical protein
VLSILEEKHVPFAVAGAFALQHHTGICRETKDLDIFLPAEATPQASSTYSSTVSDAKSPTRYGWPKRIVTTISST